jgi:hypothetical protein
MKKYIDTETCGLYGIPVLLQYAAEEGPITLYEIWKHPIWETLRLIEDLCEHTVVGFNLSFDWFHLAKVYTIFRLCPPDWIPEEHINEIALLEPKGQDGPCIKPASALDLLLHSRKGPMQSLMAREDVRIKRVPTVLAYVLAVELEHRVRLDDIYFARSADPEAPRWAVFDRHDRFGEVDADFKDVVLRFNPAGGLKFLAEHVLKLKPKFHYTDVEPDPSWRPKELGYAPTALAISTPEKNWEVREINEKGAERITGYAWPGVIARFINHWSTRPDAREYANDDIVYTRALDHHFGDPTPGDTDSILACMVAVVRWHGFTINLNGMKSLRAEAQAIVDASPVNINKPAEVRSYICAPMDEIEKVVLQDSTKKTNLETVAKWEIGETCTECKGSSQIEGQPCWACDGQGFIGEPEPCLVCNGTDPQCTRCGGTGHLVVGKHPAAIRSKTVLKVKSAAKEVEVYDKLILAGKFHASFNVIGALSSRMSGADGLNAQGIKATERVRRMFTLAWDPYVLCGGDFDAFEVTIADAVCNDEALREELLAGRKIHALFGMALFPGFTYEEIKASAGTDNDMYTKGKQGFFGTMLYGGDHSTLMNKLGIREDIARAAIENFGKRFTGVKRWRQRVSDRFCSMRQPEGIGHRVIWVDPSDYCETFLGFRRYFTLENTIAKVLFNLANKPPPHWKEKGSQVKVIRRDRVQTAGGAVQSALYGAAFAMQAANMRAAANHEIQSPGAEITKAVQRHIWDLQPVGIHELLVAPLNVHDEIAVPTHPDYVERVTEAVRITVEGFRPQVPLIGMTWNEAQDNWAEKKHGSKTVKIKAGVA